MVVFGCVPALVGAFVSRDECLWWLVALPVGLSVEAVWLPVVGAVSVVGLYDNGWEMIMVRGNNQVEPIPRGQIRE